MGKTALSGCGREAHLNGLDDARRPIRGHEQRIVDLSLIFLIEFLNRMRNLAVKVPEDVWPEFLGDPLWDTSSSQGRLLSTLLAAIADFERDLIRERTGEGRKRAMAAGTKFGRPRKFSDYQRQEAIKRRADGETLAAIRRTLMSCGSSSMPLCVSI